MNLKVIIVILISSIFFISSAYATKSYVKNGGKTEHILFVKFNSSEEVEKFTFSYSDWMPFDNSSGSTSLPPDSNFHQAIGFNIKQGTIIRIGIIYEVFLKMDNDYFYVKLMNSDNKNCWGVLPNGEQEPLLIYSDEGLKFVFDENLNAEQIKICNQNSVVELEN